MWKKLLVGTTVLALVATLFAFYATIHLRNTTRHAVDPIRNCEYNADWSNPDIVDACANPKQR